MLLSHPSRFMFAFMTAPFGSLKLVSEDGCRVANHGPIGDSSPIAFLGHARGHRVILETGAEAHKSPNFRVDTLSRPERLNKNPTGHRQGCDFP